MISLDRISLHASDKTVLEILYKYILLHTKNMKKIQEQQV